MGDQGSTVQIRKVDGGEFWLNSCSICLKQG